MGELLDKLNSLEESGRTFKPMHPVDQATKAFQSASRLVNAALEAAQEPGMALDTLARFTRLAPLQALAVAFLVGVLFARRR